MYRLYSILLAGVLLYAAPIIGNPLSGGRDSGGSSVHFKTVDEGIWPYPVDGVESGQAQSAVITLPATNRGQWI